jgi:hypothetical protein
MTARTKYLLLCCCHLLILTWLVITFSSYSYLPSSKNEKESWLLLILRWNDPFRRKSIQDKIRARNHNRLRKTDFLSWRSPRDSAILPWRQHCTRLMKTSILSHAENNRFLVLTDEKMGFITYVLFSQNSELNVKVLLKFRCIRPYTLLTNIYIRLIYLFYI